jgi:hypothetical protein
MFLDSAIGRRAAVRRRLNLFAEKLAQTSLQAHLCRLATDRFEPGLEIAHTDLVLHLGLPNHDGDHRLAAPYVRRPITRSEGRQTSRNSLIETFRGDLDKCARCPGCRDRRLCMAKRHRKTTTRCAIYSPFEFRVVSRTAHPHVRGNEQLEYLRTKGRLWSGLVERLPHSIDQSAERLARRFSGIKGSRQKHDPCGAGSSWPGTPRSLASSCSGNNIIPRPASHPFGPSLSPM